MTLEKLQAQYETTFVPYCENEDGEIIGYGDIVEFKGQDSYFKGIVTSIYLKLNNESVRCIVEDERGLNLVKNPKTAKLIKVD